MEKPKIKMRREGEETKMGEVVEEDEPWFDEREKAKGREEREEGGEAGDMGWDSSEEGDGGVVRKMIEAIERRRETKVSFIFFSFSFYSL